MKRKHTLRQALIAACLVTAATASAQFSGSGQNTDLYLAIRGASKDLFVDIGPRGNYNSSASFTVPGYTASWVDTYLGGYAGVQGWGVFGQDGTSQSPLWLGSTSASLTDSSRDTAAYQANAKAKMATIIGAQVTWAGANFGYASDSAVDTSTALLLPNDNSSSYTMLAKISGTLNGQLRKINMESHGATETLYYVPNSQSGNSLSPLGTFTFNSDGSMLFTGVGAAVPEPGTYAFMGLGAVMILVSRFTRIFRRA